MWCADSAGSSCLQMGPPPRALPPALLGTWTGLPDGQSDGTTRGRAPQVRAAGRDQEGRKPQDVGDSCGGPSMPRGLAAGPRSEHLRGQGLSQPGCEGCPGRATLSSSPRPWAAHCPAAPRAPLPASFPGVPPPALTVHLSWKDPAGAEPSASPCARLLSVVKGAAKTSQVNPLPSSHSRRRRGGHHPS